MFSRDRAPRRLRRWRDRDRRNSRMPDGGTSRTRRLSGPAPQGDAFGCGWIVRRRRRFCRKGHQATLRSCARASRRRQDSRQATQHEKRGHRNFSRVALELPFEQPPGSHGISIAVGSCIHGRVSAVLRINLRQILAPVWLPRFFHARSRHISPAACRLIERTQTNHQVASGAGFRRCPENQTYEEQR